MTTIGSGFSVSTETSFALEWEFKMAGMGSKATFQQSIGTTTEFTESTATETTKTITGMFSNIRTQTSETRTSTSETIITLVNLMFAQKRDGAKKSRLKSEMG